MHRLPSIIALITMTVALIQGCAATEKPADDQSKSKPAAKQADDPSKSKPAAGGSGGENAPKQDAPKKAETPGKGEFPDNWFFYGNNERLAGVRQLVGKPAPELSVKNWIGDPQKLADLKGKVVIVEFWGTWCPPCRASIPHNIALVNTYKDQGLAVIGIHDSTKGFDQMPAMAKEKKINYPLAVDDNHQSERAYHVPFWPTYIAIDRKGIIRAAGLEPGSVEKVVKKLIQEKAE